MLYLNKKDIEQSVYLDEVMDQIEHAYSIFVSGEFYMPPRPSVEYRNKTLLYMPCFIEGAFGTKILTVFPENAKLKKPAIDGLMLLNDYVTGEPTVLMDGKTITSLRTGAVGGTAIRHLAKKDANSVGIIGAGAQGFYQVCYACTARDIKKVYIYDPFATDLNPFISKLKDALIGRDLEYIVCDNTRDLVIKSDIIITATTSQTPVLDDDTSIFKGKCFVGVGSYKPNMREYPPAIFDVVDKVYTDLEFACEECGDLCQPLDEGILTMDRVKIFGEFLKEGKPCKEETTFFKTVGMALFDLTVAQLVFKNAKEKNIGQEIIL